MDATTDVSTMSKHLHVSLKAACPVHCIHGTAVVLRDNSPLVKQLQCTVETEASQLGQQSRILCKSQFYCGHTTCMKQDVSTTSDITLGDGQGTIVPRGCTAH